MAEGKEYNKEQLFLIWFLYQLNQQSSLSAPVYFSQIFERIDKPLLVVKSIEELKGDGLLVADLNTPIIGQLSKEGAEFYLSNPFLFKEVSKEYEWLLEHLSDDQFISLLYANREDTPPKKQNNPTGKFEHDIEGQSIYYDEDGKEIGRQPIRRAKASEESRPHHALSVSETDEDLLKEGYINQGLIGYCEKEGSESLELLKQVLLDTNPKDYFYYIKREAEKIPSKSRELESIGYIPIIPQEGTTRLYRYFRKEAFDHFYCTDPHRDLIDENGYKAENWWQYQIFLTPSESRLPVYVYSTDPSMLLFRPLIDSDERSKDQFKYKRSAPFWSDSATDIDEFGRESLVRAVVRSTNKLFDQKTFRDSYTIHLNGEWGAGKSSMLKFFKKELEATNWKIVEYNAWENQSFRDPWWILINAISKRATKGDFKGSFNSHRYWKFKMQYRHKFAALALIGIFAISAYFFSTSPGASSDSIGFYGSLIGLVGAIVSVITGLTTNFFYKDISEEDLKKQFSDHPFKPIRDRFNVIAEQNKLAIFVDDLDRCNVDPTVTLLEGIQNLFKGKKVLYIIAADGAWVSQCFTKKYESFKDLEESGVRIGDKFLQKSFQLKIDVPEIGEDYLNAYWSRLIDHRFVDEEAQEMTDTQTRPPNRVEFEKMATEIAKAKKEELDKSLEHAEEEVEENIQSYLVKFLNLGVPQNPRQMKRFVNQYVVARQTRIIETGGKDDYGDNEKDIKHLIFAMKYPSYHESLKRGETKAEDFKDGSKHKELNTFERDEIIDLLG